MVCDIASGMKYLHKNDILNKNLDPNNILINDYNHPILTGFGIPSNRSNENYQIYSPPEILRNEEYNKKADVYSFGLVVNEIYSRQIPFAGLSSEDIIQNKNNGNFEIDASMPDFLQNIVRKCIDPNPELRPTFKDIISDLKNNDQIIQNLTITSYLERIKYLSKQIKTFSIPRQILKPLPHNIHTKEAIENPIDFTEIKNLFPQNCSKKGIIITVLGNDPFDKISFVGTITGNAAHLSYVSNSSHLTYFTGILVDGPYTKGQLALNILDENIKYQIDMVDISDDTQIFFAISQDYGISYFGACNIIHKITEMFCAISTACISIVDANSNRLIEKVRSMNLLPKNKITQNFVLVKKYHVFDSIQNVDIDTFGNHDDELTSEFYQRIIDRNESELTKNLTILPIGNYSTNYKSYNLSVWYSFFALLSKINNDDFTPINKVINLFKIFTNSLYGVNANKLQAFEDSFKEKSDFQKMSNLNHILIKCLSCSKYALYLIERISPMPSNSPGAIKIGQVMPMATSQNEQKSNQYKNRAIEQIIVYFSDILLPLLLNDFDISVNHIRAYSNIVKKDLNTFLKVRNVNWLKHVNFEENRIFTDDMYDIDPKVLEIPEEEQTQIDYKYGIISSIIFTLWFLFGPKSFKSSAYPLIWNLDISTKYDASNYPIYEYKPIGGYKEQLIIFTEQDINNNSIRIFRALTGFGVDVSPVRKRAILFKNVNIAAMMDRFKKNRMNAHTSKLLDPPTKKVHILFLKGIPPNMVKKFCKNQIRKPIIVSSMIQGQPIQVNPGPEYEFNMFVVSKDSFDYATLNRKNYVQNMERAKEIVLSHSPQMKNMNFLPVQAEDLNLTKAGPICNELVRYGCRFILKDESFYKDH